MIEHWSSPLGSSSRLLAPLQALATSGASPPYSVRTAAGRTVCLCPAADGSGDYDWPPVPRNSRKCMQCRAAAVPCHRMAALRRILSDPRLLPGHHRAGYGLRPLRGNGGGRSPLLGSPGRTSPSFFRLLFSSSPGSSFQQMSGKGLNATFFPDPGLQDPFPGTFYFLSGNQTPECHDVFKQPHRTGIK